MAILNLNLSTKNRLWENKQAPVVFERAKSFQVDGLLAPSTSLVLTTYSSGRIMSTYDTIFTNPALEDTFVNYDPNSDNPNQRVPTHLLSGQWINNQAGIDISSSQTITATALMVQFVPLIPGVIFYEAPLVYSNEIPILMDFENYYSLVVVSKSIKWNGTYTRLLAISAVIQGITGLTNIPVTDATGSIIVAATSLKFVGSTVAANGSQAVITNTGGVGGVTSINTPNGTAQTGDIILVGSGNTTVDNPNNKSLIINSTGGGGGGNNADFIITPLTGVVPLTVQCQDLTQPVPTVWAWTIGGTGVVPADYTYTNGSSATSQNPYIILNRATTYIFTLTPTKAGITYTPFSTTITPTAAPVVYGDLTIAMAFASSAGAVSKAFYDYSATDVFAVTVNKVNAQTCAIVTNSYIIVTGSPPPTFPTPITADNVNSGATVNTSVIPQPNFPAVYNATVFAEMNNSDNSITDKSPISNAVNYYVPALWIQNSTVTPPTFITPYQPVKPTNYVPGQSFVYASSTIPSIQVLWVAFPKTFTTPPNAYILVLGLYAYITRVSDTPTTQTINGQLYTIYGFQLSSSGLVYTDTVFLETTPTGNTQNLSTNFIEPKYVVTKPVAPKISLFQKWFGAKS